MLMSMYTLFFRYRCAYMHWGYFGVWFWILNLSQTEQVFTQYSRLFSFLGKRGEGGRELFRLQGSTCFSVCASLMVLLLGPCLNLN